MRLVLAFALSLFSCSKDFEGEGGDAGTDGGADSGDDAAPGDGGCDGDSDTDTDTDSDVDLCTCLRNNEYRVCTPAPSISCVEAEDCCDDGSSIPCGYFGNRFACVGGLCREEGCSSHAECQTYAKASELGDPDAYGCLDPVCGVGTPYCGLGAKACARVEDCCLTESEIPCGTWGNLWNCYNERCSTAPCECDSDCVEHANALGREDAEGWLCIGQICGGFRICSAPRPCEGPADCCDGGSPIPCGTFGNRFKCHRGQCFEEGCDGHAECVEYARAEGLPDPERYGCPGAPLGS